MTQLAPTYPDPKQMGANPMPKNSLKKKLRLLIPLGLLLLTGLGVRYWLSQPDDSLIRLSGRIEGYETDLGRQGGWGGLSRLPCEKAMLCNKVR